MIALLGLGIHSGAIGVFGMKSKKEKEQEERMLQQQLEQNRLQAEREERAQREAREHRERKEAESRRAQRAKDSFLNRVQSNKNESVTQDKFSECMDYEAHADLAGKDADYDSCYVLFEGQKMPIPYDRHGKEIQVYWE